MEKVLAKEMRQAIKRNELDAVKFLIENNEEMLDVVTVFGTFLHDASVYGRYDIASYLIECGMDVNKKGGTRDSGALTVAAFNGHRDIVELLFSKGALLDVSSFERNPLFAAIYNGHLDIVQFLVEKGIDLKASYAIGSLECVNAYEYARLYGRVEIVDYLRNLV